MGLRTVEISKMERNEQGQFIPVEVPNSENVYECDLCILAMGFIGPETKILEQLELELAGGRISTPNEKYNTSTGKVFAAGDCRRGQSLIVWAIHEGRQAARQIDHYLTGKSSTLAGPGGIVIPLID